MTITAPTEPRRHLRRASDDPRRRCPPVRDGRVLRAPTPTPTSASAWPRSTTAAVAATSTAIDRAAARHAPRGARAHRSGAGRRPAAQEPHRHRRHPSSSDRPPPSTCSGSRASSSSTPRTGDAGALERGDDVDFGYGAARAHNRGMVDFCSRRPAAAAGRLRAARMDFERPNAHRPARRSTLGAAALMIAVGVPATSTARSHVGLDPRVGAGRRRRASRSCSTSAAGGRWSRRTSRTACRRCPTSTAATATSVGRRTWRSRTRRCRRWPR